MDVSRSEVTHSYFQVYYFMNYVNGKARLRCIHNIKSKTILYLGLLGMAKVKLGWGPKLGPEPGLGSSPWTGYNRFYQYK